jgi:hypothetical protein
LKEFQEKIALAHEKLERMKQQHKQDVDKLNKCLIEKEEVREG